MPNQPKIKTSIRALNARAQKHSDAKFIGRAVCVYSDGEQCTLAAWFGESRGNVRAQIKLWFSQYDLRDLPS